MESTVLVKAGDMRVVLFAMDQGRKMNEHHAAGTVSVHVLRGGVRLRVGEGEVRLGTGGLLVIGAEVKHDVEALEESVFLLTIGGRSAKLSQQF